MYILFKIYIINKYSLQSDSDLQADLRPTKVNQCVSDFNVHLNHQRNLLKCRFGLSGFRAGATDFSVLISSQVTPMLPGPKYHALKDEKLGAPRDKRGLWAGRTGRDVPLHVGEL